MPPEHPEPDPWTPERIRLRDWLHENAPRLDPPYQAAVRLLHLPEFPARRYLVSHLVREIANGLPAVVTGRRVRKRFDSTKALDELAQSWLAEFPDSPTFTEPERPAAPSSAVSTSLVEQVSKLVRDHKGVEQTNRDKTALLIDALRPGTLELRPAIEPVIRDWAKVVAWFVNRTHVPRGDAPPQADEAELQRQFRHFEDGLRGITQGHFQVVREIDSILDSSLPSSVMADRLIPLLGGAQQLRYFFAHPRLESPAWLSILEERGFFAQPPEPIIDHDRGFETHVRWPASAYLVRMASIAEIQEQVARIAGGVCTTNEVVRDDLINVALRIPPALAAGVVPSLIGTLQQTRWRLAPAEELGALMDSLARSGQRGAAGRLLKALVEVVPDPTASAFRSSVLSPTPRTRIDPRELDRALTEHLTGIMAGLGLEALEILSRALDDAVRLSRARESENGVEDYSHIWRPRIEVDDDDDARDVLVSMVRRAAECLVAQDSTNVPLVLDTFERRGWAVFKRLELYVLTKGASPPRDRVVGHLLDRRLFDGLSTEREYRILLQSAFGALTEEEKAAWLGWIEASLPSDKVHRFLERWHGSADEEDVRREQRRWQWEHLGPVRDSLPASWRPRWFALQEEFGEPAPVERAEHAAFQVSMGWESPLSADEARAMSAGELATYLKAPTFPSDRPFASPEGLREIVANVVARSPQPYAEEAQAFEGLAPTYVRGVLDGFASALSEGRDLNWGRVLDLAGWVLKQPVLEPEPEWTHREDPGWGWTRGTVTRLLEEALKRKPSPVPAAARRATWELIETLCHDPNPRRRADGLGVAIHYASWLRIQGGQPWDASGTLDDVPEVRTVLDEALDLDASPSPVVHEIIGHWLSWLVFMDEAWVRSGLPHIFPTQPEHAGLWQAAWRSYLRGAAPLKDRVFDVLSAVYEVAIGNLESQDEAADEYDRPERLLAEHLAILHGRGTLEARGASALLDRFFEKASANLRRHFFWYVGHSLEEQTEPMPADVLRRFRALWEGRRERARTDPPAEADLPSFGMWFSCGRFDEDWALGELEYILREAGTIEHEHLVVERLARMVPDRVSAAMRCFGLLVRRLREPGSVHGWLDDARIILGAALRSDDAATRAEGIDAFHRLGGLGFRAQELVPFSNDLSDAAAIPYFTWDHPMTIAEVRTRLKEASEPERDRLLGLILREAKDTDVWRFTTPREVAERWSQVERHLGRRRGIWQLLLDQWKEQGLLAS